MLLEGLSLEASTAPEDAGARAAPRRLEREEKPLYDLGQELRAAVEENRAEGRPVRKVVVAGPAAAGGLLVSLPLEREGAAVGLVQVETRPRAREVGRPSLLLPLAALAGALVVLVGLALALGERRWPLALAAALLLVAALGAYGAGARRELDADRARLELGVSQRVKFDAEQVARIQGAPPAEPGTWDADAFGRPRGLLDAAGVLQQQVLAADSRASAARWTKLLAGMGVVGLALLGFVALGAAARFVAGLRRHRWALYYVAPAMLGMLVLVFFPFFYGVALSFTDQTIYTSNQPIWETWIGIGNFVQILGDFAIVQHTESGWVPNYQNFYYTLIFTIIWTITNVSIGVSVGLLLALILNTKGLAARPVYRVLLILPWALPNYITALIWRGMFHQQFGVINQGIRILGGSGVAWFEHPVTSYLAVLTTNAWLSFPFMMVISLGSLQSIPGDLYEAARVDGASRWQQFRAITLPSLKPALVPAVILSVIWTFNMFNIIYLVSAGEPAHSTEILITQAYKLAFEQYRYGYAAAYSTVIFLILLVYGTWQNRVTRATEGI
ncbi:MAG: sugar ABC transporter permease [Acidobacteria bacterium]|nr:sugar ABC transporter permease [Acidobacteriota bacterium]